MEPSEDREFVQGPIDYGVTGSRHWYDLAGWEQDRYLLACFLGEPERAKAEGELHLYDRIARSIADALLGPFFALNLDTGQSEYFPESATVSSRIFARRVVDLENTLLGQRLLSAFGRASATSGRPPQDPELYASDPLLFFEKVAPVPGMEALDLDCLKTFEDNETRADGEWNALGPATKAELQRDLHADLYRIVQEATGNPLSLFELTDTRRVRARSTIAPAPKRGIWATIRRFFRAKE